MNETIPNPACLRRLFSGLDGVPLETGGAKLTQTLFTLRVDKEGLSKLVLRCPVAKCRELGKLTVYPEYRVVEWPSCPYGVAEDETER